MVKLVALLSSVLALVSQAAFITAAPIEGNGTLASGDHNGDATFFFQGGAAGACGQTHSDSDLILALGTEEFANGGNCGKTISIRNPNTGVTAQGIVADLCPGCNPKNDIDLSVALFTIFEPESVGVFPVVWRFLD